MIRKYLALFLLSTGLILLTGCSVKQVTPEGITPGQASLARTFDATVSLTVEGGRLKDPLGLQEIADPTLSEAVASTIQRTGLFKARTSDPADYALELFIVKVGQPLAGYDMTVNVEIAWILKNGTTGEVLWKQTIETSATRGRDDEASGANRLVMALEAAARKNIAEGFAAISRLDL